MGIQSFNYTFTPKELKYFLFKKKQCPKCGGMMRKEKRFEMIDGTLLDSNTVPLYILGEEVKNYLYFFICQECGSEFNLKELSK